MQSNSYKKEICGMVENFMTEVLDSWNCQDWGVSVQTFMSRVADDFCDTVMRLADEIIEADEEEEEDE